MPITSSAKKALRSSANKRQFNLRRKKRIDDAVKNVRTLVAAKKGKDALQALSAAYQAIDKAAKAKQISKNTAARRKSRLAALAKKAA